jgi:hypothetical protein
MYNSLLLPGNGTNLAQNNTFLDGSTNNFTITRNGNTTQGTYSPYGSNWSNYFNGSTDYLGLSSSTNLALGAGDFTIEVWLSVTAYNASTSNIFEWRSAGGTPANIPTLYLSASGVPTFYASVGAGALITGSSAVALNTWTHLAIVRSGSTVTMYLNGTSVGSATNSANLGTQSFYINDPQGSYRLNGYFSNVRMVKGTAVYTGSFTPSTTPLTAIANTQLLTCQSNRFIDNSSNAFALTVSGTPTVQRFSPFEPTAAYSTSTIGGSAYIATAATSYLSFTDSSNNLDLGGAVASFETWIYPTAATCIIAVKSGGTADYNTSNGVEWSMPWVSQQFIFYYNNGGSYSALTDPTTGRPLNQWYHYAVASNATTISLFVNGVRVATATANVSKPTNRTLVRVGEDLGGNGGICYLSDTRSIRGAGAYDPTASTITIPTSPVTAVANTQLLLSNTNAGIIDNTMINNLETVGNAQISTAQSKFGGSSMYFDGTGDWLIAPRWTGINASENLTMETWIYMTASPSTLRMLLSDLNASNANQSTYWTITDTGMSAQFGTTAGTSANGTFSFSANTWYHIALVRNSNVVSMYVNGTSISVANSSQSASFLTNSSILYVGRWGGSPTYEYIGYIDDLRITKGYARYTANFTPPTQAFPLY